MTFNELIDVTLAGNIAYDEDVAEFVKPKSVNRFGSIVEIPRFEGFVDLDGGLVELVEDPPFCQSLVPGFLSSSKPSVSVVSPGSV